MTYEKINYICYDIYDVNYNGCSFYGGSCIGGGEKAEQKTVLLRSPDSLSMQKQKHKWQWKGSHTAKFQKLLHKILSLARCQTVTVTTGRGSLLRLQ